MMRAWTLIAAVVLVHSALAFYDAHAIEPTPMRGHFFSIDDEAIHACPIVPGQCRWLTWLKPTHAA